MNSIKNNIIYGLYMYTLESHIIYFNRISLIRYFNITYSVRKNKIQNKIGFKFMF